MNSQTLLQKLFQMFDGPKVFIQFHYAISRQMIINNYGSKYTILIDIGIFICTLFLLLISALLLSICGLYKLIIYTYLRVRFGGKFQGLITGMDMLTILAPGCDGSVHGLTRCSTDKPFNSQILYDIMCKHIHQRFYETPVDRKFFSTREFSKFGYNYFLETNKTEIGVEDIVKTIKHPNKSQKETVNDDELMEIAQMYYNSDLPANNKFNWDVCLCLNPLEKNVADGRTHFVIFTRMHHTLGDGLVILNVIVNNLYQMGPEFKAYSDALVNKCKHMEKKKMPAKIYRWGYKNLIDKPCILRDGRRHIKTMFASRVEEPSDLVYLEKLRIIRRKFPGVITANIFMAAYSASLCQYYLKYSDEEKIPEKMFNTLPVQLNVKRFLDIYASSERIKLQNEVSHIGFHCPLIPKSKRGIPIEDYMIERLMEISEEFQRCFNSMDIQAGYIWAKIFMGVFPYIITSNLFHGIFMQTCTTCLPGGPKLNLFTGDSIESLTYFLPRQYYTTLFMAVNTYDGRLQIGFTADEEKFHNLKKLNEIRDGVFHYLDVLYDQSLKYEDILLGEKSMGKK